MLIFKVSGNLINKGTSLAHFLRVVPQRPIDGSFPDGNPEKGENLFGKKSSNFCVYNSSSNFCVVCFEIECTGQFYVRQKNLEIRDIFLPRS